MVDPGKGRVSAEREAERLASLIWRATGTGGLPVLVLKESWAADCPGLDVKGLGGEVGAVTAKRGGDWIIMDCGRDCIERDGEDGSVALAGSSLLRKGNGLLRAATSSDFLTVGGAGGGFFWAIVAFTALKSFLVNGSVSCLTGLRGSVVVKFSNRDRNEETGF